MISPNVVSYEERAPGSQLDDDRDVSNSDPAFGRHIPGRRHRETTADSGRHSPCDHRRWACPDPGATEPATRARSCLAARAAADHLLGRGEDELERVPLQPAPYRTAGDRLCRV